MEHQCLEWKESWRDEYLKELCAFANAGGGTLLVGVNDRGVAVGVAQAKRLLEDLPNKIRDKLGVVADVSLELRDGKECLRIDMMSYPSLISYNGRFYYRSGSTVQELNGNTLHGLLLGRQGVDPLQKGYLSVPCQGLVLRRGDQRLGGLLRLFLCPGVGLACLFVLLPLELKGLLGLGGENRGFHSPADLPLDPLGIFPALVRSLGS